MKRLLYILCVIIMSYSCKHTASPIDTIIADYKPLSHNKISEIHSQLINTPEIIDSAKLANIINNRDNIRYIDLGDKYLSISDDVYRIDTLHLLVHKKDSLINILALDSYIKAYNILDNKNYKIPIIHRVALMHKRQGQVEKAKKLYKAALDNPYCNDSLEIIIIKELIGCFWDGSTEALLPETAIEMYSLQKRLTKLQHKLYPCDTLALINEYVDLAYLGYVCNDYEYIENCKHAIFLAESSWFGKLWATFFSMDKSPYFLLGDYYLKQHEYSKALNSYNQLFGLDPIYSYNPDTIFTDIINKEVTSFEDTSLLKIWLTYPLQCIKKSICYQGMTDYLYKIYLYEAFYWAVRNTIFNGTKSPEGFTNSLNRYHLIFDYICSDSDTRWGYNSVLFRKGLSNNIEFDISKHVDSTMYHKYLLLKTLSKMHSGNGHAFKEMRDIEVELFDIHKKKGHLSTLLYTYKDVWQAVRKKRCVAIEFTTTCTIDDTEPNYIAFAIDIQHQRPYKIELCKISELQPILSTNNLLRIYSRDSAYNQKITESYHTGYNLIWSKLEPYINEGDDVYFSPDGLLYQMNIEVLQDANGRRANEKWNLHRVSSTRELCMEKPTVDINSAALYGGLTYEMDSEAMLSQSRAYNQVSDEAIARGFIPDSTKRAGWRPLPATLTEISSIARMCKSRGMTVDTYTAMAGNEESFKVLSGKKTPIIHLATHGFFYKNEEVTQKPFFNAFNFDQMPQKPDNSLKRTGLILAGGQKAWLGEAIPDNVEDGILLAEEIASMDLTGTDLVVLSACETGLGEITSEGVFGLQRAFKKAGVQTLIMSLWKVDDGATSLFMQTFYKHWLDGKSKHEAFTMAQKTMQEHPDYSNPYYWAAFIMLD